MQETTSGCWDRRDSSGTSQTSPLAFTGVLHPHFSHTGDQLLWAELLDASVGVFGAWALKLADFVVEAGTPRLENIETFRPGARPEFYESHGFTLDDSEILFSANSEPGQVGTEIDIYRFNPTTGALANLTRSADWDEHAQLSPDGSKILWMSSRRLPSFLTTDFWIMNLDGSQKERITFFNTEGSPDFIPGVVTAADTSWNAAGTRVVAT